MRLTLKENPEQVELIKAMGSRNQIVAREASEAFAAFLGPVVQEVIQQAGTASGIYQDAPYDEDDSPSYPLDLYYNESKNFITVWSQNAAGGMPSSHVEGLEELKISTYRLDSAISFNKRYARRARLDVISKAIERMAQEVLVKQERNAWAVALKALANASTGDDTLTHAIRSTPGDTAFTLALMNTLLTRMTRINESFAGGTPANPYSRLTDLYMAPERMADIRSFAYNAVGNGNTDLPANVRENVYNAAGASEIYGVSLHEMVELGVGKKYCTLFSSMGGSGGSFDLHSSESTHAAFDAADDLMVGFDNSKGAFLRPIARNAESGSTFVALPDDQYNVTRADKAGFYGSLEEGRVCIDARAVCGLILDAA